MTTPVFIDWNGCALRRTESPLNNDTITHLRLLEEPDCRHWFQTKPDKKGAGRARKIRGTLHECEDQLDEAQDSRCGVFIQIQRGYNRKASGIYEARFLFLDFDGGNLNLPPLRPTLVVKTPRGWHVYYKLVPTRDLNAWDQTQIGLQQAFGADSGCNLRNQVARLAGYYHLKDKPTLVSIESCHQDAVYLLEDFEQWRIQPDFGSVVEGEPTNVADYRAIHAEWPFNLCRERLNTLLGRLRRAPRGKRFNTLKSTAASLGSYAAIGVSPALAIAGMRRIVESWEDYDHQEGYRTINRCFALGYQRGRLQPPRPPGSLVRDWERTERAGKFLEEFRKSSLPPIIVVDALLQEYPEWKDAFKTHRQAVIRVGKELTVLGYCQSRTKKSRRYIFRPQTNIEK